jgi:hypothetical protein
MERDDIASRITALRQIFAEERADSAEAAPEQGIVDAGVFTNFHNFQTDFHNFSQFANFNDV